MGRYLDLLRVQGVFRVVASQVTARFPYGMLSIILLLHVQATYGDYTSAGIVLAAECVGQAVAGPLMSRLMGRFGSRSVLGLNTIVCALLLAVIALSKLPLIAVIVIALCIGLSTPPVASAVRTIYPKLVPGKQLSALFSLDAAAQELIWVLGPVIAVFITSQFGTAAGLLASAGVLVLGGAWFIFTPAVGAIKIPLSRRRFGAVLRYPTVIISTLVGFLFVAAFAAVEAGVVAVFTPPGEGGHGSIESGIVLALFAGGSLVGGLLFGHRTLRPWSLALRVSIILVGVSGTLVSTNIWWLGTVLFIGGLDSPAFAAISNIVSVSVKFSETAESYGWITTGQLVGAALGSAIAGAAIDLVGAHGAMWASTGLLALSVILALATIRWIPDLKGHSMVAPPETNTISLPLP